MTGIRHPEFLNSLENTTYPFVANATLTNGTDSLLEGTILDAHLYAPVGSGRYYLSAVKITSSSIQLTIGDLTSSSVMTGTIQLPVVDSIIRFFDSGNRPAGVLISEPARLSLIASWGLGTHSFNREDTEFCVTCQVPVSNPGVTGLRLPDGEVLTGKIWLLGENGVVLTAENLVMPSGETVTAIKPNVVGDPMFLQRLCNPDELFTPINSVRTIRIVNDDYTYDCLPDEQGNFNIQMNDALAPDAALRIRTTPEGIVVTVEGTTPEGT
mgnify:CR=1 FL=1|tara:strand:+ start:5315 stop:6121 length:807 start_codon:yes stop_codon:yes gene_type:complete